MDRSYLKPGRPVSNALLGLEKQRIITQMQERGFADFTFGNFGAFEATDTTDASVRSRLNILPGQNGTFSRKYIGHVTVNNRFSSNSFSMSQPIILDSLYFLNFNQKNRIKPTTLLKHIMLRPGELYRKSDLNDTRVQLQLPAIQFADIRSRPQVPGSDTIDFEIDLYPAKRIETNLEFELNRTTVSSQSFIGLGSNVSLINNNFLGGSERLSNGVDISFEVDPKLSGIFNAANVNFHNTLEIPRFGDYLGFYPLLNKSGLLSDEKLDNLK